MFLWILDSGFGVFIGDLNLAQFYGALSLSLCQIFNFLLFFFVSLKK